MRSWTLERVVERQTGRSTTEIECPWCAGVVRRDRYGQFVAAHTPGCRGLDEREILEGLVAEERARQDRLLNEEVRVHQREIRRSRTDWWGARLTRRRGRGSVGDVSEDGGPEPETLDGRRTQPRPSANASVVDTSPRSPR